MGRTLYLECTAGISGDMTVAALLDLGADEKVLMEVLESIPAKGFTAAVSRVKKAGIDCCDFSVNLDEEHENHDHDMAYLHGDHSEVHTHVHEHGEENGHDHVHEHGEESGHDHQHEHGEESGHDHQHEHGEESGHDHQHDHDHGHAHHHHEHRGMAEITAILDEVKMTPGARALAGRIFDIVAEAESKAHAVPLDEVHFHEVGAIDSIVDVVAVSVCIDNLGITDVIIPRLCEGIGTVRCQHGVLPVPVPATANIAASYGLNLHIMNVHGEFVTPTGAAIAAAIKTSDKLPENFKIQKIGTGAGKRTYERPSILRAMLIEPEKTGTPAEEDRIIKLESNIDDCTGENLGFVMELLLEAGARDVHYTPVYMKKNRPGWQLNVICDKEHMQELERIIFCQTSTIGIRRMELERSVLRRECRQVPTPFGDVKVKVCTFGEEECCYPEYESVARIAKREKLSYQKVYQMIVQIVAEQNRCS